MEEDKMSNNYKESTLERLDMSKEESSTDRISTGDIENNNNLTNNNMNKVFITLTMILPNEKIFNNKEKALK